MILKEDNIDNFVESIKKSNSNLEEIMIKYSHQYAIIKGHANPNIIQDDDYYENVRDHITFSGFSWIDEFSKMFKRMDISMEVLPDGTFNHSNVNLSVNVILPKDDSAVTAYIYRRFQDLSKYNQFLHSVRLKGTKGKINSIQFEFSFDVKKLSKIIREKSVGNKQLVEQWMYITEKCQKNNRNVEVIDVLFPVVSGKIHYEVTTELVSEYISLSGNTTNV